MPPHKSKRLVELTEKLAALERRLSGRTEQANDPVKPKIRMQTALKVLPLSALVYPALFFSAGWFVAFRSEAVRAFYGGIHGDTIFSHVAWVFTHDRWVS